MVTLASTVVIDLADGRSVEGARFIRKGTINLGVYATNGIAVTAAQLELPGTIADLDIRPAGGIVFEWDKTNSKIKAFRNKDPGAAGGADIALPEVANAVDITATAARFYAKGY